MSDVSESLKIVLWNEWPLCNLPSLYRQKRRKPNCRPTKLRQLKVTIFSGLISTVIQLIIDTFHEII